MKYRVLPVSILLLVVVGCGGKSTPESGFSQACEESGLCECTSNQHCSNGAICVNGWCEGGALQDVSGRNDTSRRYDDVFLDVPREPGSFLWPCEDDEECDSGLCISISSEVSVCTMLCITECPEDWECRGVPQPNDQILFYCLPSTDRLCQACKSDESCPGEGNLCLEIGGTHSCGRSCEDVACPGGYTCEERTSVDGVTAAQCVPDNGYCLCTPENVGQHFACEIENEYGTCPGDRLCLDNGEMSACSAKTPAPEICDGLDNDCDGLTDNDVPTEACEKTNDHGTCTGERICAPGIGEICQAQEPAPESCDGLDNNCDGVVDEPFKDDQGAYGLIDHCGGCNQSCAGQFANAASVVCDVSGEEPACKVTECEPGFILTGDGICVPAIHHLCEPCTEDSACVGQTDKCMSMSPADPQKFCGRDCSAGNMYGEGCPEGYLCKQVSLEDGDFEQCVPVNNTCDCSELSEGMIKPCKSTNDWGTCFGMASCDPGQGWIGCTAAEPAEEVCDGADNDCDGLVDEELSGGPCQQENEFGVCVGVQLCLGFQGPHCTAVEPEEDICDGKDNDCDGQVDEDFATNVVVEGELVAVIYDMLPGHCGGCNLPCAPTAPATAAECVSEGELVTCVVTACEAGFYPYQGTACLPLSTGNLCLPCSNDEDCVGPDDACVAYPDGGFCGWDCTEGSLHSIGDEGDPGYCTGVEGEQGCCPSGYLCTQGQCVRESMACDCDTEGKFRPCQSSNEHGLCQGIELCVPTGPGAGWQPCDAPSPEPEICDGVDNDCDGLFDAQDDSVDTSGLAGYPDCANVSQACPGVWACGFQDDSYTWYCTAEEAEEEICDGVDNDCDGEVDEGYAEEGVYLLVHHCGQCGLDCRESLAHLALDDQGLVKEGAVACQLVDDSPTCVPQECEDGYYLFPAEGTPSVCLPLATANCQPCGQGVDCAAQQHICLEVGSDDGTWCAQRCDAGALFPDCTGAEGQQGCCPEGFVCQAVPGQPEGQLFCKPESGSCQCTGENDGFTRPCTVEGNDKVCFGISTCQDQGGGVFGWSDCDAGANVEVCDGLDNDCDGEVDEGFQTDGEYLSDENCGACGKNCKSKWSESKQHAVGVCVPDFFTGPYCAIGSCTDRLVGGGRMCSVDDDCAGDPAGEACLDEVFQCGQLCEEDGDCPGGDCVQGTCAPACGADADCEALYGAWSVCEEGSCRTEYQHVDLDGWTGNGCECPAIVGGPTDEPDLFAAYPLPGASYVDRNCDGIDGDMGTALFVAVGSEPGDGSFMSPFNSIQAAVDAFDPNQHGQILVATGQYSERVVLKDQVRLFGGYSPDFASRDVVIYPSIIEAPKPADPGDSTQAGTLYAAGIEQPTLVAGFTIRGYDLSDSEAGHASYAVYLTQCTPDLELVNNRIEGGRGGPGLSGQPGPPGQGGGAGQPGLHSAECTNTSCNNQSQPGGVGGVNDSCPTSGGCPGMEAEGGEYTQSADNPPPGCSYGWGGTRSTYQGGPPNLCKYDCWVSNNMHGANGGNGGDGGAGTGGGGCSQPLGFVSDGLWMNSAAQPGGVGSPGGRGMGGAAGCYVLNNKNVSVCNVGNGVGDLGGSGGGGGAGGCGGNGGNPGTSGGAGVAVFLVPTDAGQLPGLSGNVIIRGTGGNGGSGGSGGTGGKGGPGGSGGLSGWPAWCAGKGGAGGRGGDGGVGGGGGGGCGGPSIGLAAPAGSLNEYEALNNFPIPQNVEMGGAGGAAGASLAPGGGGAPGSSGGNINLWSY